VTLSPAVKSLRSPQTIRTRAAQLLASCEQGELRHFAVDMSRLPEVARLTAELTRKRFPTLEVPPHSRFNHFDVGNIPRRAALLRELAQCNPLERARRLCEVVVISVLLDAGAGSAWRYHEAETGMSIGRSEGLAIASLCWASWGGLSSRGEAYAVDAQGLVHVDEAQIAHVFQVRDDNPLVGLSGRVTLLRALGETLLRRRDVFGVDARIGGLIDVIHAGARDGEVAAEDIFAVVLDGLGEIWPGRLSLDGVTLGDVWHHPAVTGEGASAGLMPLHKLSQWLAYSLIHPLENAGLRVRGLDALTGLAEYRNGGLFVDLGVLVPKHPEVTSEAHEVGSEVIVEWRALTVALLDRLAPLVREALDCDAQRLPLAAVLEGGSWALGRKVANERRASGDPPIRVISDGTVF
jgi:hypothetical protein